MATCFIAVYTYAVPTPTPAINEPIRKQSCGNYTETVPLLGNRSSLARSRHPLSPTNYTLVTSRFGGGIYIPIFNFHPLLAKFGKKEINRISSIFY